MSKTTLLYKDVAPGAALDAAVTAPAAQTRSVLTELPGGTTEEPAATGELNQWGLDGSFALASEVSPAFWSEAMSGADGSFAAGTEPQITIAFSQQYSSVGISFRFDTATGGYCSALRIQWYQGTTLKAEQDFTPDSVEYFCQKRVESYNKVVLTFRKTNLPYRYAKVDHVIFGVHRSFGMAELRKASAVNEIDLSGTTLPSSKLSWTLDSRDNIDFMFQLKQPVEVRNDNILVGVYYIDSYKRTSGHVYPIECCDAIGVLNDMAFAGGVYSGKSAKALIAELAAPFEVEFDADVADLSVTGILKAGTRRGAIQQLLFVWGYCVSTDGRAELRVFSPGTEAATVPPGRTFLGASASTEAIVTEVQVTAHTYAEAENGDVEVNGVKYADSKTVYSVKNPNVTATDKQKVVKVTDATLVSPDAAQTVAQRLYAYHQRRSTGKAKVVFAGERLGDCLSLPDNCGGATVGNLEKMEIKLSNTVVYTGGVKGV